MPVTVERVPNEPILIAKLTGKVDKDAISEMFRLSVEAAQDIEGTIYRITDTTNAESELMEMLGALRSAAQGIPGSTSDPRYKVVFVGRNKWTQFTSVNMDQDRFGNVKLPIFLTLEEAINYIHTQIDEQKSQAASE